MDDIGRILRAHRTIHVVGLSSNRARASFGVAQYLQEAGYQVIPVNPRETEVLGETAYPSLSACPEPVRFIDVFRRGESLPELTDEILSLDGVEIVWLQLGVRDEASEARLRATGIFVVADRCTKIEHAARAL